MATESTELLTLHDAADRLGVHYMTVYRRVRLGMFPAHKVGGQWRVDPADLRAPDEPPPGDARGPTDGRPPEPRGCAPAPWADRLRRRMLAGDVAGSWQVVEAAMAAGVEPTDVYVEILGPAMHGIGADGSAGRSASIRSTWPRALRCRSSAAWDRRFQRRGRRLGTVLVAMPTGERHMLGAAMLADILAQAGYEVLNLGADTPPASLARAMAAHDDLRAVIVTVVDSTRLPRPPRLIAAARRIDGGPP